MLPNLSYTIPVTGRITIGDIVENDRGKRIPIRLNHFRITTQYKRDGQWGAHPIQAEVAKKTGTAEDKITESPVKLMFNSPSLTIRERFEAYQDGRLTCASCGTGNARRVTDKGMETVECHGPEGCAYARTAKQGCDLMARINVQIDAESDKCRNDPQSSFILRTRGYNSARTIRQKLEMASASFKGNLVGIPFILKLRKKSTPTSYNTPFYYVDLVLACSMIEAAKIGKQTAEEMMEAGLDQNALEQAVLAGMSNGPFEDTIEEMVEMEDMLIGRDAITEPITTSDNTTSISTGEEEESLSDETAPADIKPVGLDAFRCLLEASKQGQLATAA